jgi:hypothetical protein
VENVKASANTQQSSIAPIFAAKMSSLHNLKASISGNSVNIAAIFAHHMLWSATA